MSGQMNAWRTLYKEDGTILLVRVKWCSSFWCKFKGLMLQESLPEDEGLVFEYGRESKMDTSIHMLFMRFPIATVWLNNRFEVVDKVLARPWRLAYAPKAPAQYVLEAPPNLLNHVMIGDRLVFESMVEDTPA